MVDQQNVDVRRCCAAAAGCEDEAADQGGADAGEGDRAQSADPDSGAGDHEARARTRVVRTQAGRR